MVGLPGSGKTQWVKNHITSQTDKHYTVIGNHPLFDRMTVSFGLILDKIRKINYSALI